MWNLPGCAIQGMVWLFTPVFWGMLTARQCEKRGRVATHSWKDSWYSCPVGGSSISTKLWILTVCQALGWVLSACRLIDCTQQQCRNSFLHYLFLHKASRSEESRPGSLEQQVEKLGLKSLSFSPWILRHQALHFCSKGQWDVLTALLMNGSHFLNTQWAIWISVRYKMSIFF